MKYEQDIIDKMTDAEFISERNSTAITWNTPNKVRYQLIKIMSYGEYSYLPADFVKEGLNANTDRKKGTWFKKFKELTNNYMVSGDLVEKIPFWEREPD